MAVQKLMWKLREIHLDITPVICVQLVKMILFRRRSIHAFQANFVSLRRLQRSQSFTLRCSINSDSRWMQVALSEARAAQINGEVPIGAVVVSADGHELARAGNAVEQYSDPSMHAEMRAVRKATERLGQWRLLGTTLYSSLEPCAMCISVAALARVSRVVYGAKDLRLGACGTWVDLTESKHPFHEFEEVRGGLMDEESAQLMKSFFRKRRMEEKAKRDVSSKQNEK